MSWEQLGAGDVAHWNSGQYRGHLEELGLEHGKGCSCRPALLLNGPLRFLRAGRGDCASSPVGCVGCGGAVGAPHSSVRDEEGLERRVSAGEGFKVCVTWRNGVNFTGSGKTSRLQDFCHDKFPAGRGSQEGYLEQCLGKSIIFTQGKAFYFSFAF